MKKFFILSIDGGGVRGLMPAMILEALEKAVDRSCYEMFDLFAGTSTGGLLITGLTASRYGFEPSNPISKLVEIYKDRTQEIFPVRKGLNKTLHSVKGLFRPEFSQEGLRNIFKEVLGDMTLSNCIKPLIIPSFDIIENKPLFFKSRYLYDGINPRLVDICSAATAAPTFFSPYSLEINGTKFKCIDGGVFMNNPSLTPLFELSKHRDDYLSEGQEASDVYMLSLGTGDFGKPPLEASKWGVIKWAREAMDSSIRGAEESADYGARELLPEGHYMRVDLPLGKSIRMSDASTETRDLLIRKTEEYIKSKNFKKLVDFVNSIID